MPADAAPREELRTWLAELGRNLASAMESARIEGDRVDHVIALLLSLNVPRDHLAADLPPAVVQARRKIFGPTHVPPWLEGDDPTRLPGSARSASAPSQRRSPDASDRIAEAS